MIKNWFYPLYFFIFGLVMRYGEQLLLDLSDEVAIEDSVFINNVNLVIFIIIPCFIIIFLVIPCLKKYNLLKIRIIYFIYNFISLSFTSWFWITQTMWKWFTIIIRYFKWICGYRISIFLFVEKPTFI